ncbi:hypothetical protein [Bradyrhizobium sp. JYMT SZCCT0180]|uniref:hypothetical protein n=1 Tax=Bradyrhizobium sp. JYMT SZCCT0180 TaxID=2807666 RepID=UPI001BAD2B1C|nr:hypothetical protein [Bradyrhizobium sp. JYMT SZCCT0180]MBR1213821.1 hypothetical protein [Bradyrhizobium sp. JYMT SZCCT0180]
MEKQKRLARPLLNVIILSTVLLAAACSPQGDDHFTCAAMIGAASQLVTTGRVAADDSVTPKGLYAAMTHLNAWAIPKGLKEREAFDNVLKERERLLRQVTPNEIVERAKVCIARIKAK